MNKLPSEESQWQQDCQAARDAAVRLRLLFETQWPEIVVVGVGDKIAVEMGDLKQRVDPYLVLLESTEGLIELVVHLLRRFERAGANVRIPGD